MHRVVTLTCIVFVQQSLAALSLPTVHMFKSTFSYACTVLDSEAAAVTFADDLRRHVNRGSAFLLILLVLLAAFDTINHGTLPEGKPYRIPFERGAGRSLLLTLAGD